MDEPVSPCNKICRIDRTTGWCEGCWRTLAEIAGWYGMIAILTAYALVSFEVITGNSLAYQLLNLTGSLGILVISLYKKVLQSIGLNSIWIIIAVITIILILTH